MNQGALRRQLRRGAHGKLRGAKKSFGTALVIAGILVAVASLLADYVGLGGKAGIGWKQTSGLVVGVLVGATGLIMRRGPAAK